MVYVKALRSVTNHRSLKSRQKAKELGEEGERIARQWLAEHGYTIIDNNYQPKKHEIDLVAIEGGDLVIIEVKTRNDTNVGSPEDAVDHSKRQFLINMANQYVRCHNWHGNTRFDVVGIIMRDEQPEIHLTKNAFNVMCY
jgi:putative endonuclease